MKSYLLNAFSLNIISDSLPCTIEASEITANDAIKFASRNEIESAVGHAETAAIFSKILNIDVECARKNVAMSAGDIAIVGQYSGPRLPEGATSLPEGAKIKWIFVCIE